MTASSFFIVVPTVRVTSVPEILTALTLLLDPAVVTAKSLVDGTLLESRLSSVSYTHLTLPTTTIV